MSKSMHRRRGYFQDVDAVARALSDCYSDHSHENKANPLSELLFILCSLQTNEELYQSTYASLRARFPTFRQLADAKEDEIASVIAHGGLARQKARTIRAILSRLESDFGDPTLSPLRAMTDAVGSVTAERHQQPLPPQPEPPYPQLRYAYGRYAYALPYPPYP